MQLDAILEVTIGLIVTWLIISMATSHIQETLNEWFDRRSRFLDNRLMDMLKNRELVDQFYGHPLIQPLATKFLWVKRKPVNIPNDVFAKAATDIFLNAGKAGDEIPVETMSLSTMKQSLKKSMKYFEENNEYIARTIKHLVPNMDSAIKKADEKTTKLEDSIAKFRKNTEAWFDTTMSQASAKYRKNAQTFAFFIGILLAGAFNVDSLYITGELWRDPTLRQAIVAQASNIKPPDNTNENSTNEDSVNQDSTISINIEETKKMLAELSLPVGWNKDKWEKARTEPWFFKVIGFVITGLAAAQGGPFWFDILRKLSGIKSQSESKADKAD